MNLLVVVKDYFIKHVSGNTRHKHQPRYLNSQKWKSRVIWATFGWFFEYEFLCLIDTIIIFHPSGTESKLLMLWSLCQLNPWISKSKRPMLLLYNSWPFDYFLCLIFMKTLFHCKKYYTIKNKKFIIWKFSVFPNPMFWWFLNCIHCLRWFTTTKLYRSKECRSRQDNQ